jgi:hypothetical protein
VRFFAAGVTLVAAAVLAAGSARAHERITTAVTWDREVSAIFRARCVSCHRDGGASSIPLTTWAAARPWARSIRHEVLTRQMPIWNAARGYGDFANDPSLSPFEIALITAWVDGGAPRSFVPKGSPAIRLPGPPETPLVPDATPEPAREPTSERVVACGDRPAPPGRLLGLHPEVVEGKSVRVVARMPDGRRESLGWFEATKDDPVYWLRSPLDLPPASTFHIAYTAAAPRLLESKYAPDACRVRFIYRAPTQAR